MPFRLPLYEPPVVIPQPDGSRMLREGFCCRCGVCCTSGNPLAYKYGDGPVPGACYFFKWEREPTETEKGLGTCTDLTNEYRLRGCNVWPSEPDHVALYKDCSYTFKPYNAK